MAVTADANVTFWYGCNMTRHGEIVRLVTQMLEAVGVDRKSTRLNSSH